jgi:hypothetical protein
MARFTPMEGQMEATSSPNDVAVGTQRETQDGTHTNEPVMTHHAVYKCRLCASKKWKVVNAPPVPKRQVPQVIGSQGSGIKPMVQELVKTKMDGPGKWRKGSVTQTTKFVNQIFKLVESDEEAFAHVHILKGTPKHETEVVERCMSGRITEVQGYRTRERDNQMDVAIAYDRRETDRANFEERAEELLAKGSNEINKLASGITKHSYTRREAMNYTAIQQLAVREKCLPPTTERTRNIAQATKQAQKLQTAGTTSPQRMSTLVRGFVATPVT